MSFVSPALLLFGQGDGDAAAFQEAVFAYGHLGHLLWCHFQETDLKKTRPFHMHQQDTCNLPQCIAEQVFKSKACLVLYWRRYDVHCTAAHTSLHKGKYTFVRPNKVFRTLANCHALGVAELKKNAVLTSLHPLPHQLLMQILASGAAS